MFSPRTGALLRKKFHAEQLLFSRKNFTPNSALLQKKISYRAGTHAGIHFFTHGEKSLFIYAGDAGFGRQKL